ncbi:hypothetical protein JCM30237_11840 [Halolamina litorea]|uniref:GIY-YIG domain-containing protein n=1 Tax=Halolamina litorea TaxID=1515593 RepID=A0ABD6BLD8_9EURY|nr:hypothetical protein [Halolamina litorea]
MTRRGDLDQFYSLLQTLDERVGGAERLGDCTGYMDWPDRGVYIFLAPGETRESTPFPRVTRIGTHAVSAGSSTSMWDRLRTHRGANGGTYEGGGNHRGSVFRKRVGEAILERDALHGEYPQWGNGSTANREQRLSELALERRVSEYLRDLRFLWIAVDDEPGPESDRAYLERNAIALLSNRGGEAIDPRKEAWLGHHSRSAAIRESGLWNVDHVDETHDPAFLSTLESYVEGTDPA